MLTATSDNPIPNGAISGMFERDARIGLRYACWRQTTSHCLGTVCLFTGRREFIEKYFEVIGELRRRGFAVATMDWRGQGGSTRQTGNPMKGHVDHFSEYENDVAAFMREIVLTDCPGPYFALAHSMGGHVLFRFATRAPNPFERMVLVAPMLGLDLPFFGSVAARRVTEVLCLLGLGEVFVPGQGGKIGNVADMLTSDPARFQRMADVLREAPELDIGAPTFGWLNAALQSMEDAQRPACIDRARGPILMVVGTDERVVAPRVIEETGLFLKAGQTLFIPQARHEILMEQDVFRDQFWAAFDAFVPGQAEVFEPDYLARNAK